MTVYKDFDYAMYKPVLVDGTGRRLTVGLFKELADPDASIAPLFSLADWRTIYVDIADPTGYRAHKALIGDYEHWLLLVSNQRFAVELKKWNEEVEIKLKSEAIANMVKLSKTDKGVGAAKWLAENGFAPKTRKTKEQPDDDDGSTFNLRQHATRLGIVGK